MAEYSSICTEILSEIRPNSTFLTVHHYMNNWGEVADFSICFHVDYLNAVKRSLDLLSDLALQPQDCDQKPYSFDQLSAARNELLESFQDSLKGHNPRATSAHAYDEVTTNHKNVYGVKLHINQDVLHLWGFISHKRVHLPANYGPDRRYPKTIAKDDLRNKLPVSRFRQFKLQTNRFHKLVVERRTIKDDEVVRQLLTQIGSA